MILPELMCSFQRLSHACTSLIDLSRNRERLITMAMIYLILINPKWITVENLELIHALKLWPYGKAHLLEQNHAASAAFCWLRITKLTAWPLCRRRVFQASTLSTWREHNRLPWLWRITEDKGSTPEKGPEKWPLRLRMAAGAQITHSRLEEVVTRNNETVLIEAGHRNGYNLNPLTSIKERASLVPAAAVIPASPNA